MQEKLYLHRKEDLWKIYHQHQQRYFSTQREWFTKLDIAGGLVQCCPPQANRVGNNRNLNCGSHCGQPYLRRQKHARSLPNVDAIQRKGVEAVVNVSRLNLSVQLFASVVASVTEVKSGRKRPKDFPGQTVISSSMLFVICYISHRKVYSLSQ